MWGDRVKKLLLGMAVVLFFVVTAHGSDAGGGGVGGAEVPGGVLSDEVTGTGLGYRWGTKADGTG